MSSFCDGSAILVTGGTGSFGQCFTRHLLEHRPKKVIILSRDELKQYQMAKELQDDRLRFLIGDVRDRDRLRRAFEGVDIVIHAAAMKQVPACEYNPAEAVKTNIDGAWNVIQAALECEVKYVVALSSDKCVDPVNLYGATKLVAERLFVKGNIYRGSRPYPKFSVVRYGNVVGSRGSVIPLFKEQAKTGVLTITDERMTRFWMTLDRACNLVEHVLANMEGGEIYVPANLPGMKVVDLAKLIAPEAEVETIGIRPGEKMHEVLISHYEVPRTYAGMGVYIILPENSPRASVLPHVSVPFAYSSATARRPRAEEIEEWLK